MIIKKLILILAMMTPAVMALGCTGNQYTNKTYSGNGISFTYPGNWSEMFKSDIQNTVGSTTNLRVSMGEWDDKVFAVGKVNLQSGQKTVNPVKWG